MNKKSRKSDSMTNFFWYLLPTLFGFVGHAIVSNSFAYENRDVVKKSFKMAIASSCGWGILMVSWFVMFVGSD